MISKEILKRIDKEELAAIAAQGYCTKRNEHKIVDPDLLQDIAQAICRYIRSGI